MAKKIPSPSVAPTSAEDLTSTPEPAAFRISAEPVIGDRIEGDVHKFGFAPEPVITAAAEPVPAYEHLGDLPASYDQDTLFLIARDPRWLFCYWDFDWLRHPAKAMRGGVAQFFLKISTEAGATETLVEIKPEARNWYVPVSQPATTYRAEIGWFDPEGGWHEVVQSSSAATPAEALAEGPAEAEFATLPVHLTFERMLEMVREKMSEGESLIAALARIAGEGRIEFRPGAAPTWSDEQKRLLTALLGDRLVDRVGLGSEEIDQLLRKQLHEKLHTESASQLPRHFAEGLGPSVTSLSSGLGASWSAQPFSVHRERGFFLHVNAEIIFYGGTHPDATVRVEGKQIQLSADGSFRYHFTLPDGDFELPIVAESPDGVEQRSAKLSFTRGTQRTGDVGSTSQPAELQPLHGKR